MSFNIAPTLILVLFLPLSFWASAEAPFDESNNEPFGILCDSNLMPSGEGQHQWGSSYANWNSQSAGGAISQSIKWLLPAPKSFHTNNFALAGASGGYIGLQAQDINADGSLHTNVRFSIWDTVTAEGAQCRTFGGEGVGYTCELNSYPVMLGTLYTLTVERSSTREDGTWWQGAITNQDTQEHHVIGRILVKHEEGQRLISSSSNFSEYFGPRATDCRSVPQSVVSWTAPVTTSETGVRVADEWREFTKATPDVSCDDAGVEASGERMMVGDTIFYRMTNGSVPMCHAVPLSDEDEF